MRLLFFTILVALSLSVHSEDPGSKEIQDLSALLKKGSTPGIKLPRNEKLQIEKLLITILPDNSFIGTDKEWEVTYHDMDKGDFFQVNLKKKGDQSLKRFIWFHILYKQEKPEFYGSEDFGRYRGMGMKDTHYFILVGNLEIRAVADSEQYKNDSKIKGVLNAFKLKDIEKL